MIRLTCVTVVVLVLVVVACEYGPRPCVRNNQCEDSQRCDTDAGDDDGDGVGVCVARNGFEGEGEGEGEGEPPVHVDAVVIEVGGSHTCAIDQDARVQCWGANGSGQLGRITPTNFERVPAPIAGLTDVVDLAVGDRHACALGSLDGGQQDLHCWGALTSADVGTPGEPIVVGQLVQPALPRGFGKDVVDIDADGDNSGGITCAASSDGVVYCFGGSVEPSGIPLEQDVAVFGRPDTLRVSVEAKCGLAGSVATCIDVDPVMALIGCGAVGRCPVLDGGEPFSVQGGNVCRIDNGDVLCAGNNEFGVAAPDARQRAVVEEGLVVGGATDVGVGEQHACALVRGVVECWGRAINGATGYAESDINDTDACEADEQVRCQPRKPVPLPPEVAATFTSLDVHRQRSCAIDADGVVMCFGLGFAGAGEPPHAIELFR